MKERILQKALIILLALGATTMVSCKDEPEEDNISKYDIVYYKWHLTKFVDIPNKIEKFPQMNSDNVYWIKFDSQNDNFSGRTYSNSIKGLYQMDVENKTLVFSNLTTGNALELYDGDKFFSTLSLIQNFHLSGDTLRLLYNNKMNYMQFEKIE